MSLLAQRPKGIQGQPGISIQANCRRRKFRLTSGHCLIVVVTSSPSSPPLLWWGSSGLRNYFLKQRTGQRTKTRPQYRVSLWIAFRLFSTGFHSVGIAIDTHMNSLTIRDSYLSCYRILASISCNGRAIARDCCCIMYTISSNGKTTTRDWQLHCWCITDAISSNGKTTTRDWTFHCWLIVYGLCSQSQVTAKPLPVIVLFLRFIVACFKLFRFLQSGATA